MKRLKHFWREMSRLSVMVKRLKDAGIHMPTYAAGSDDQVVLTRKSPLSEILLVIVTYLWLPNRIQVNF